VKLVIQGKEFDVQPGRERVIVDGKEYMVRLARRGDIITVYVNERPFNIQGPLSPGEKGVINLLVDAKKYQVEVKGRATPARPSTRPAPRRAAAPSGAGAVVSQMTGRVIRVDVQPGNEVKEGDLLLIIEAMKMENEIVSPVTGTVREVAVAAGARVSEGDLLVVVEAKG